MLRKCCYYGIILMFFMVDIVKKKEVIMENKQVLMLSIVNIDDANGFLEKGGKAFFVNIPDHLVEHVWECINLGKEKEFSLIMSVVNRDLDCLCVGNPLTEDEIYPVFFADQCEEDFSVPFDPDVWDNNDEW